MPLRTETIKKLARTCAPEFLRKWMPFIRLKEKILDLLGIRHQWLYDLEYYANDVYGPAELSAPVISSSIIRDIRPRRVVDVGCGTGALLAAIRDKGCDVMGLEYSDAGLAFCRSRRLQVEKFNIASDAKYGSVEPFDVAISTEVAEHLPEYAADRYIDLLTNLARVIVFTAAPPGQGGLDHINEQPRSYWISKFDKRHFEYDYDSTTRWKAEWERSGVVSAMYYGNLMIFRGRSN